MNEIKIFHRVKLSRILMKLLYNLECVKLYTSRAIIYLCTSSEKKLNLYGEKNVK